MCLPPSRQNILLVLFGIGSLFTQKCLLKSRPFFLLLKSAHDTFEAFREQELDSGTFDSIRGVVTFGCLFFCSIKFFIIGILTGLYKWNNRITPLSDLNAAIQIREILLRGVLKTGDFGEHSNHKNEEDVIWAFLTELAMSI